MVENHRTVQFSDFGLSRDNPMQRNVFIYVLGPFELSLCMKMHLRLLCIVSKHPGISKIYLDYRAGQLVIGRSDSRCRRRPRLRRFHLPAKTQTKDVSADQGH